MTTRDLREFGFRIAAGVGLGVSLALLWSYSPSGAELCQPGGGCDAVRDSGYASVLGVPTPAFGVLFFAVALALAAVRDRRARALLTIWRAGGGGVAIALLVVQAVVIGAFCVACVIANGAALLMAVIGLVGRGEGGYPPARTLAATGVALAVAALPFGYAVVQASELPDPVADAQVGGVVTIVEFIDFQCPFCQQFHHQLHEVLPDYEGEVAVARIHVPMPANEHSDTAAAAALCADDRGLGDEMADYLMHAPAVDPETVTAIGVSLGMDRDEFSACIGAPKTMERIRESQEAAVDSGVRGLPTIYIGRERFEGVFDETADLRAAIDRAIARGDDEL